MTGIAYNVLGTPIAPSPFMADADLVPVPNEPPTRIIVQPSTAAGWEDRERLREHVKHLAFLMDRAFVVPGTNFRIGIDPILGLIPILGDLISMLVGGYIIWLASKIKVPKVVLWHMTLNVGIDAIIGAIPFLGDALDMAWRANSRNAALLEKALNDPRAAGRSSFWQLLGISVVLILLLAGTVALTIWLGKKLVEAMS